MKRMGFCPSGRLFEAAACGAAILSDAWAGIDAFFEPGVELALVESVQDVEQLLAAPPAVCRAYGEAARARVIAEHTSRHRASELERLLAGARAPLMAEVEAPPITRESPRARGVE
jgi:spore maturation protein CgeB